MEEQGLTTPFSTDLRKRSRSAGSALDGAISPSWAWDGGLRLAISGIRFELSGLSRTLERDLAVRFGLFTVPEHTEPVDLSLQVRPAVVKGYLDYDPGPGGSRIYRLETRVHESKLHVWSYAFAGWFEIEGSAGEISLCDSPIEPHERSIENFLRVAFAWKASRGSGFLLHASGLVRNGRAYVFFGPSGSGKTSITRLSPYDLRLNDDCIHISSEGGLFRASGVPFKGNEDGGAEHADPFPIAGLFRLVQSKQVACAPLGAAQAVTEIVASIPFVSEQPAGAARVFGTAEALARSVPVMRLQFRLAPDFWGAIEEAVRG
jgi:hypothetical protein